ncbi:hypothetical protein BCR44DRAFT_55113 [Catenaria anguillulae PL171]|uniref:Uncharacterized protein n=1 Tax=Catenaria anguillulae PL171 TaxID=765915 RepID=A0A1Y2HVG9_9FUNG|nr:hypothetical protein BCR44DRAFT_55113 [Catenaria anguillulae PL171]
MYTSSPKSPVLVILPPTHKCPDLERVLKLARRAFDDVSLNILDLNLRFAWVADDELQKDEDVTLRPAEDAAVPAMSAPLSSATPAASAVLAPPAVSITGATFYPPRPLGPNKAMVRSVALTFGDQAQIKEYQSWIQSAVNSGTLAGSFAFSGATTPLCLEQLNLALGMSRS